MAVLHVSLTKIGRADHLVENVLEGRLKGDKTARGIAIKQEEESAADAKKAKTKVKDVKAVRLEDATVQEYEEILAKVRDSSRSHSPAASNSRPD